MYTFKPATDRILHERQLIRDRVIQKDAQLLPLYTEADKLYQHVMPIIKKGLTDLYITQRMTVEIEDFELIVGSAGKHFCGSTVDPRYHGVGFVLGCVECGEWTLREDGL